MAFTFKGIKVQSKLPVTSRDLSNAVRKSTMMSNREKDIMANLGSIEITETANGQLIIAEFFHKNGNGFDMVVSSTTRNHKPGDITN